MTLAIQRFFVPAVRLDHPGGSLFNLDSTGLRFDWNIVRDNTQNQDEGEITVYNLAPAVAGAIFEAWQSANNNGLGVAYNVAFHIGWDRIAKLVMIGQVWDLIPDQRTPADVLTVFKLGDGNNNIRDQTVGRDFHGVKLDIVLDYLVQLPAAPTDAGGGGLGLIYPPESKALVKAAAGQLPYQFFTNIPKGLNTREAITLILETLGLEWRVHNGEFIVLQGGIINRPGPILRPGTGLIHFERRNDGGCILTANADPEVEPGIQIQVQNDLGRPFAELAYRVERVSFFGSTDNESTMQVEAGKARLT